jgi:uncharacterized membrane protein YoaT (DUF817 family)
MYSAVGYFICSSINHFDVQAKEFGRKAVAASATIQDEEFSRTLVEFVKVCENVRVVFD